MASCNILIYMSLLVLIQLINLHYLHFFFFALILLITSMRHTNPTSQRQQCLRCFQSLCKERSRFFTTTSRYRKPWREEGREKTKSGLLRCNKSQGHYEIKPWLSSTYRAGSNWSSELECPECLWPEETCCFSKVRRQSAMQQDCGRNLQQRLYAEGPARAIKSPRLQLPGMQ